MAVSTTSFTASKLEVPLPKASPSSRASSPASQLPIRLQPIRIRKTLIQRGVRCEVAASDALVQTDKLSALEQLKTSAADSNSPRFSFLHFLFVNVCFLDL